MKSLKIIGSAWILMILCTQPISAKSLVVSASGYTESCNNFEGINVVELANDMMLGTVSIDSADSVFFSMNNATYNGTHVSFPIYFDSDDLIYSFDYSFKFNQNRLVFDTISMEPAGQPLLAFFHYNTNDSTVRFTSSHLVSIPNGVPIALIHFDFVGGTTPLLDSTDLFTLKSYLNGDACSEVIIPPTTVGLNDNLAAEWGLTLFPVPTSSELNIKINRDANLQVLSLDGKLVMSNINLSFQGINTLNLQDLQNGIYLVRVISEGSIFSQKIVIAK
ncbi:MAG: T9SS type A sorting domain-containing protein [Bacteroidetes bacterium]|nr:T9SS type A sorting domain-containing protein [Bacteroidota bacterium]